MRREDESVEKLFDRLRATMPALPEEELRAVARAASAVDRVPRVSVRSRVPRWARVAALAVVLGVGVGFGLATWLTPVGSATSSVVGFGFLPAKGWTVVQSGTVGATGAATAIAANVPLNAADALGRVPRRTLASLPPRGVVIFARFTTRGDPAEDAAFPVEGLPLRLLGGGRLRAGVEGYNVDVRVYFGTTRPSAEMRAAAQAQLNRLVVASERITIFARSSTLGPYEPAELFGAVESAREGEEVTIQAKDCGSDFFHVVAGTTTRRGGGWSAEYFAGIGTTVRAVWDGTASSQIGIRKRAIVRLTKSLSGRGYQVVVTAQAPFWRKRVNIQRFDRRLGRWVTIKAVVLTDQAVAGVYRHFSAKLSLAVPRGTLVRAFLPLDQARPCYLAAASAQVRT